MTDARTFLFAALCGAVFVSPLWADADATEVRSDLSGACPQRAAELERWLKGMQEGGQARRGAVLAVFGDDYYHPFAGFDRNDHPLHNGSVFVYDLDKLGVHDHRPHEVLTLEFDPRSGLLRRAAVEEEERQTGFNINAATGP